MGQEIDRVAGLIGRMHESGALSPDSTQALFATGRAVQAIRYGLGHGSSADELLLATILVDDSPSIEHQIAAIQQGHGAMLDALAPEHANSDVLVHTRAFNGGVLSPYEPIEHATRLSDRNFSRYTLQEGTPLYLQSLLTLGIVMTKAREEEERGAEVRTFTLIITDGEDNMSAFTTADHVSVLVKDMLEFSTNHIVAGMGIGGRGYSRTFMSMGIPERWIFPASASVDALREVFRRIASALQLATSEDGFRQLGAGPAS